MNCTMYLEASPNVMATRAKEALAIFEQEVKELGAALHIMGFDTSVTVRITQRSAPTVAPAAGADK